MMSRFLTTTSSLIIALLSALPQSSLGFSIVSAPSVTPLLRTALHMDSTSSTSNNGVFDLPEDGMMGGSSSSSSDNKIRQRNSDLTEQVKEEPRYLTGDELHRLRQRVLGMRQSLQEARREHAGGGADTTNNNNDSLRRRRAVVKQQQLIRSILAAQKLDGEFMYQVSLERREAALQAGLVEEAAHYAADAAEARSYLPQFQLDGLWVGKYGDAFQMVNVSYTGDVLTAHKVTGDRHVPKGQVTFTVDLSPLSKYQSNNNNHHGPSQSSVHNNNNNNNLDPIELSSDAVEQWGSKYLQRHAGRGQVAGAGFTNSQWLDGQLILVNQYFSFAWLPTGHQVFFGRPSAELVLKLLRNASSVTTTTGGFLNADHHHSYHPSNMDDPNPRQYLARCLEETELLDDDMEVSDGIFRSHDQHYYYDQAGCFE